MKSINTIDHYEDATKSGTWGQISPSLYQKLAISMAFYPIELAGLYPVLGLTGEAGEVAEKVKKFLRDKSDYENLRADLHKELGDVIWYVAAICNDYDLSLAKIMHDNLIKLNSRKKRGQLSGSGDDR